MIVDRFMGRFIFQWRSRRIVAGVLKHVHLIRDTVNDHRVPPRLSTGGCDPAARLLVPRCREQRVRLLILDCPNGEALNLLESGKIHLIGLHHGDEDGATNRRIIGDRLGGDCEVDSYLTWEIGVVPKSPGSNGSPADYLKEDYTWVNRPEDSGGDGYVWTSSLSR